HCEESQTVKFVSPDERIARPRPVTVFQEFGGFSAQLKAGIHKRAVRGNVGCGAAEAADAINATTRGKVLRYRNEPTCPREAHAERAWTSFVAPLHVPTGAAAIDHIDLRPCTGPVLAHETKRGLWLPLFASNAILKVQRRHVAGRHPQHRLSRRKGWLVL